MTSSNIFLFVLFGILILSNSQPPTRRCGKLGVMSVEFETMPWIKPKVGTGMAFIMDAKELRLTTRSYLIYDIWLYILNFHMSSYTHHRQPNELETKYLCPSSALVLIRKYSIWVHPGHCDCAFFSLVDRFTSCYSKFLWAIEQLRNM